MGHLPDLKVFYYYVGKICAQGKQAILLKSLKYSWHIEQKYSSLYLDGPSLDRNPSNFARTYAFFRSFFGMVLDSLATFFALPTFN